MATKEANREAEADAATRERKKRQQEEWDRWQESPRGREWAIEQESQRGAGSTEPQEERRIGKILSGLRNVGSRAVSYPKLRFKRFTDGRKGDEGDKEAEASIGEQEGMPDQRRGEKAARWEALRQAKEERERTGGPLAKLREAEERLRVQEEQKRLQSAGEEEEGAKKGIWLRYKEYKDRKKRDKEYSGRAEAEATDEQREMSRSRAREHKKPQTFNAAAAAAGAVGAGWGVAKGAAKAGFGAAGYGYEKVKSADKGTIWIVLAIAIALFDIFWGEPYQGYRLTLSGFLSINILGIVSSSLFLGFLIFNAMVKIIDRHLSFFMFFILYMLLRFSGAQIRDMRINALYINIAFWLVIVILIIAKSRGSEISILPKEDIAYIIFIFVVTYFWWQPGWQNESKTWAHLGFILLFGFLFIRTQEQDPSRWYYLTVIFLFLDFYGYSLIKDVEAIGNIFSMFPPILMLTGGYIAYRTENKLALILVLVFAGFMFFFNPTSAYGTDDTGAPEKLKGKTPAEIAKGFKEAVKRWTTQRLELATGGLYKGRVEENQYEKIGVYLDRVRASEPRYYTEEPVTLWGAIKAKTLSDAVIVRFGCNKWSADNKRINASRAEPSNFTIFNLEERDVECTFDPTKGTDQERNRQRFPAGTHTVTMSAEYNFATDAYLKSYYIDRDRYRAMIREELDPFQEFGITDKRPIAVYTNGPVEIGMDLTPLIPVERTSVPSPALSITLNNRGRVIGQQGEVLGEWEGRIRRINELVVLLPRGVDMVDPNILERPSEVDCAGKKFRRYTKADCRESCTRYVQNPCTEICEGEGNADDKLACQNECRSSKRKCDEDCNIFFQGDDDTGDGIEYNGYSLVAEGLRYVDELKDVDRFRTFTCRLYPTKDVLGTTPITTRFIRAKARYTYRLEKSVAVPVELAPGSVSTDITGIILDESIDANVSEVLALAVAYTESRFRHCCGSAGRNTAGDCVFVQENSCGDDRILTSSAGSVGIMQINKRVHQNKTSALCREETLNNLDCNIKVGLNILSDGYTRYQRGIPESLLSQYCSNGEYYSKYREYRGWAAALRAYNGLGCGEGANVNYVEEVIETACGIANGIVKIEHAPEDLINQLSIEDFKRQIVCP